MLMPQKECLLSKTLLYYSCSMTNFSSSVQNLAQKLASAEIEQGSDFTLQVKMKERGKERKDPMTIKFRHGLSCSATQYPTLAQI